MDNFLRDIDAIATWTGENPTSRGGRRRDPEDAPLPRAHVYRCVECGWQDRGSGLAVSHHRATGHRIVELSDAYGPIPVAFEGDR